ncbi:MAG: aldo/keto reductase [Alphaproteobacteria bacterium]
MDFRQLGRTDIKVSSVCLGSMTWGEQNTEAEGHEQLNYALSQGINFIDTAEMYAVPGKSETQGRTEEIIGTWIKARGKRDDIVLASKVTGRSEMSWVRKAGGVIRHTAAQIDEAIEGSLRRLQTDYLDLYQLHWPDRAIPGFGFHVYQDYDANDMVPLEDILSALNKHVEKGNIRHIGLSNESAWGTMKFLEIAERQGLPRPVSIQNAYNLVNRRFDYGQAEIAMREQVGLLAYSPLAQGYLTGKYRTDVPKNSRKDLFGQFLARYENDGGVDAVNDCLDAAAELGITPTQFAQKFVESREFVTSNIIGATTMAQLKENIDAHAITWTKEMERAASRIQKVHRSPSP